VKAKGVLLLMFLTLAQLCVSAQNTFEQYCYFQRGEQVLWVPMVHYVSPKNWRFEGRYNYEALNSFAFYAGKQFTFGKTVTSTFTPLAGIVIGEFNGGSVALNTLFEYNAFFLSSQGQYTFSTQRAWDSFAFNWSEIGYNFLDWAYLGVSAQYTANNDLSRSMVEPGVVLGLQLKKWSFPLYAFKSSEGQAYFVLGATYSIDKAHAKPHSRNGHNKTTQM
jgi:hypothetical protein